MSTPRPFKTYVFILLMVIFGPVGNTLLSKGMKSVGAITGRSPEQVLALGEKTLSSGTIWLGIAFMIGFFMAYMLVLSWADYSWVLPASAISYGTVALLGHFWLQEPVAPIRWAGILIICVGVFVVGRTPDRTTQHQKDTV
ncbi:MAG TPA: hypothetical protein VKW78_22450 [Terriglobales bacterium]|nr:hypothetical protein [Terriglobales bacterium]